MMAGLPLNAADCGLFFVDGDEDLLKQDFLKQENSHNDHQRHSQDEPPPSSCYYTSTGNVDDDDDISRLFMVTPPHTTLSHQISNHITNQNNGIDKILRDNSSSCSSSTASSSSTSSSSPSTSTLSSPAPPHPHHAPISITQNHQQLPQQQLQQSAQFQCDQCGFACNGADSLRAHMAAHLFSERPYACTDCNKRFREKRTLADHRRIHTGEKPFKCPLCPAKFRQIPHCNRHLKTHQGNAYRPYDCDVCGKSFARKFGLALHQRDHAKQFPFKCNLCDKIFPVIEHLGEHFRRDHK